QVRAAVGVVVTDGDAAADDLPGEVRAGGSADLGEASAAQVPEELGALEIGGGAVHPLRLALDVAVGEDDVEQAVIVHVDKAGPEGEREEGGGSKPARIRRGSKDVIALVME